MTSTDRTDRADRIGTCDSCGVDADDRAPVRRVYVTPEAWDTEGRVDVVDEVEMWCVPCRTSYPHQAVGDAAGRARRPG